MRDIVIEHPSDLVRHYRHRAKKRLGQHFLVDPNILDQLADAAGVGEEDDVLEIGPGCGTLTWMLDKRGADLLAVEIDEDAARFLESIVPFEGDVRVERADILDCDVGELLEGSSSWRCVSNLPYNAATEIYFRLAPHLERFERLVLMFQREVADRMLADAGADAYGALSLTAQLYARIERVRDIAPGAFQPAPQVHSTALAFDPVAGTRIPDEALRSTFREVVRGAFRARRKILPNALHELPESKSDLEEYIGRLGIDRETRPEQVPFDTWVELARTIERGRAEEPR